MIDESLLWQVRHFVYAHVVDEQLSLDELSKTARGYLGTIEAVLDV